MPEPGFLAAVEVLTNALLTPQEFARHKPAKEQGTFRWVTIHPHGDGEESRKIQINTETGEIEKGFGAGKTMHEAFSPKSDTPAASEAKPAEEFKSPFHGDEETRHWYGASNRPIGHATVPRGFIETKNHDAFRHGAVAYPQPLSDKDQYDYELTPIHGDDAIPELAKKLGGEMDKYASQYADPENDGILDDFLGQEGPRKLLGHVDKDKLKAEFRKQFGQPEEEAAPEPQKPEDAILSKYPSLAEPPKQAEMSEMVRAAAGYQLHGMRNEPEDRAAWREHSQHMTKSALDGWLMKKFGIDSATARAVSNAAGDMNPFTTEGAGTVGGQGVKWNHNSPEPTMEELGDMPWMKSDTAAQESEETPDSRFENAIRDGRVDDAMAVLSKLPHKQAEKIAGDLGMPVYNMKTKKALLETVRKIAESNTPEKRDARGKREAIQSANADAKRALDNADAHTLGRMGAPLDQDLSSEQIRDPHSDEHRHAVQAAWSKKVAAAFSKLDKSDPTAQALIAKAKHLGIYDADKKSPEADIAEKYPSLAEDVGDPEKSGQVSSGPQSGKIGKRVDQFNSLMEKAQNTGMAGTGAAEAVQSLTGGLHPTEMVALANSLGGNATTSRDAVVYLQDRVDSAIKDYSDNRYASIQSDAGLGRYSSKPDSSSKVKSLASQIVDLDGAPNNARNNQKRKDLTAQLESAKSDLTNERKPFKPEGVPGEQMGLFDQDASGQKSLFNIAKPDRKSKKPATAAQSELEKIGDEQKARSMESAPLPGQKSIEDQYPSLKGFTGKGSKPLYAPSDEKTKQGEEYRTALAGAGKFHASRVAAADAGVKAGHTLDEMMQDLKDEGVHEFDAKRIIGDAFNKAGKPVTRSDQPKPQPADDDWKPENHVKIAADDIGKLRKQDVYRLMENATGPRRTKMADYIRQNRPELAGEVQDSLDDLGDDSGTPEPTKAAESKPSGHAIDPLDIGKHNIAEVLENQKADILKSDPKISPNAAASLAGARVFNALHGRSEEFRKGIDDRVRKGEEISDDEDAKYIAAGDSRKNLHSDIVQHTGYRPMGEVDGHPEANKPLVGKTDASPAGSRSLPDGVYGTASEAYANEDGSDAMGESGRLAMKLSGMNYKYDKSHTMTVPQILKSINDDSRNKMMNDPQMSRSLRHFGDLKSAKMNIEAELRNSPELAKEIAKIRGPHAIDFITKMSHDGELTKYPHLILEKAKQYAADSKPYKKYSEQQFSRRTPHEELIHHLHEAMNHDGKCCYEKEEGEDDIADHVPVDHRHMDKSVHELCRHLGKSYPELHAAYENYTAAME